MEIFKMFGRIFIDNDPANRRLDETDARAAKVGNTLANTARTAARWGAAIAAGATAAGTAMFALVNRVTETAAAFGDVSKRMGMSAEELQEYRYAADQLGISHDSIDRALGRLNQRIGMAERGNAKYAESLKELNVTSKDAAEAFVQAIETLHRMPDANTRAAAAADLFGTQLARQLMPAIEAGGQALLDLRNRAHEVGAVMNEDAVDAAGAYQSALADVRAVLGNVSQEIVMKVLPTFSRWVNWTADNIPKVWAVFEFVGEVIEIVVRHTSNALKPWVELIGSILGVAWDWTVNLLGDAWDWLVNTTWAEKWQDIKRWLTSGWNWTINTVGAAWAWLVDTTWSEKLDDIRAWLSRAWTWTMDLAGDAWAWLEDHAPWLTDALGTMWDYISRAWDWTLNLVGPAWEWLRDVAWPVIADGSRTAWAFTLDLVGSAWEWLRDVAWPVITQGAATAWEWTLDAAGAAWDWITQDGWRDTVDGIQQGFHSVQESVVGAVTGMVKSVADWFHAMRNSVTLHVELIVTSVVTWFSTLRDSGIQYVEALAEGIQEWFSETKLGQTFSWIGDQIANVTHWFWDMYDKVVGRSYVPDMVQEIGEAIERLKDRLTNPVARYTSEVIASFGEMEEEVVASMMRLAEAMDKVLDNMVNRVTRAIGDITRQFWNGTATWSSILHGLAGAIGDIFGSIFDAIVKELVSNLLLQNEWLVSTLANIATAITGFLSQAYATLVAFFAWSGPMAPVLAGGVIAAAIAGIASLGGSILRGLLPTAPTTSPSGPDSDPSGRTSTSGGRQISEITGPTRDLLTDLLSPLASLNTLTGIGERIYSLLDERLPMPGMMLAGAAAGAGDIHLTIERGAIQIVSSNGHREIDDDLMDEIAEQLARKITFELRGTGR